MVKACLKVSNCLELTKDLLPYLKNDLQELRTTRSTLQHLAHNKTLKRFTAIEIRHSAPQALVYNFPL